MAHRQLMNEEQMQTWILQMLGAPLVKIELTCVHLEASIEDAKRWFVAKKGVVKRMERQVSSSQTELALPDDVETVLEVIFEGNNYIPYGTDPMFGPQAIVTTGTFQNSGRVGGVLSTYAQLLQQTDVARRVLSSDYDWRQAGRVLHVFPNELPAGKIVVEYKSNDFTIEQMTERDHELLKRYALAVSKYKLGRIRGKYTQGMPSAQGTTSLDGADLLAESKEDLDKLNEEIIQSGYPMMLELF